MKVRDDPNLNDTDEEMNALLVALTGLRKGDAKVRLPLDWSGVSGKVADVFNAVVEQNADMAEELARLRQVVGKEGKLKQRASLREARGFWGQSIECINSLIDDLVHPTSEVARVIGAVAQGDLSKSMALEVEGRPLEGEFLRTAKTINKMVEQLGNFSAEVTRVAREVGTEGKLGGQAKVKGVAGTWKDLTDSVNSMAGNLTDQVRNIADVTTAVAKGDLSKKIDVDVKGEFLTLKNTINTMVDQLRSFASEVTRVAREVGTEGSLGGQARVEGVSGTWKDLTDSVNSMAGNLTSQVRNIADVTKAVAAGDLSKKITVDVKGEILELKNTVNTMVDQLRSFAAEVTRVAREVGTEGKLGGQADVQGVAGTWKDLTESVNSMAVEPHLAGAQHRRRDDRRRRRRPLEEDHGRRQGRDLGAEEHDQHDGRPAALVRRRGDARRARGRHRRQARRPGRSAGRRRHVEGPDRLGQLDGVEPDLAGAQHRRRDQGGRGRRPVEEDHGRRQGRDPRAEEHHQHDGRPALVVRRRGDARRARGRHRRDARRPGRRAGRLGDLEGPHRLGELDGRQPDLAGAQHRRRHQGRRGGRPVEEDHRRRQGRDPRAEERRSTRWSTSSTRSPPR